MAVILYVETEPGIWSAVRDFYVTVSGNFKLKVNDEDPQNKRVGFNPKNIELRFHVNADNEILEGEQMMVQSLLNVKLNNLRKKYFREYDFPVSLLQFKTVKEMDCLGFKVSDVDISYAKSRVQASLYH